MALSSTTRMLAKRALPELRPRLATTMPSTLTDVRFHVPPKFSNAMPGSARYFTPAATNTTRTVKLMLEQRFKPTELSIPRLEANSGIPRIEGLTYCGVKILEDEDFEINHDFNFNKLSIDRNDPDENNPEGLVTAHTRREEWSAGDFIIIVDRTNMTGSPYKDDDDEWRIEVTGEVQLRKEAQMGREKAEWKKMDKKTEKFMAMHS
ncbi:hypothetical protein CC86DRAFT_379638 [Ophiobolus disseminans]|uniref:Uncharacterized protein n=1 Tax=Ophiobolus disseminans TaxID=1469910 RepID=A0A6A7AA63_9PLEO|nr:hypothetical protein CC86DRAFT_379638 [Ophiobolus disseminans]